jgi:peptidoglycan/xylan/chitin deacetylase (PgdA/CDA1 family)
VYTIILMYHGVNENGGGAANPHCISARSFEEQVEFLYLSGYAVVPWREITAPAIQGGVRVRIGLTFDDANASDLHCAAVLARHGYTALFFVPTDEIGKPGRLSRAEVLELSRQGMGIGSHSHRHLHLVQLDDRELERELRRSKAILEDLTDLPVEHIAFPGGAYNRRVLETSRQVGYRYFHTSDWGVNTSRQLRKGVLRRVPLVAGSSIVDFQGLLEKRNHVSQQIQFHVKEMAKRVLGEQLYLRARSAFLQKRSAG